MSEKPLFCKKRDLSGIQQKMQQIVAGAIKGGNSASDENGAVLGVVENGCDEVYIEAFGEFDAQKILPIASASKMPAVTAIMTLVDAGKLSLDDRVNQYLDYWPKDASRERSKVTIRMLLTHTSGLPGRTACLSDNDMTLDECAQEIAKSEAAGIPGQDFIYGGASYQVAGRVAEVISQKTWNDFFHETLAVPCGLSTFSYGPSPQNTLGSAQNPRIAGGAATNTADYLKLLTLHLSGGFCGTKRVLSAASVAEMQKDFGGFMQCKSSPYQDNCHYGLGWWINAPDGKDTSTRHVLSALGAFGAMPWIDVNHGYGAFLLLFKTSKLGTSIADQLEPLLVTQFSK